MYLLFGKLETVAPNHFRAIENDADHNARSESITCSNGIEHFATSNVENEKKARQISNIYSDDQNRSKSLGIDSTPK